MLYTYTGRHSNSGSSNFHTLGTKILSWNFEGTDVRNALLHHSNTPVTESEPKQKHK